MTQPRDPEVWSAPEWFGSAAQSIATFPVLMSAYAVFYAAWWPFAWGWLGSCALAVVLLSAAAFTIRGFGQIQHARSFPARPSPAEERQDQQMARLNTLTHPVWLLGSVALLIFGLGRWALPLMVFVIGAHFLPMARILGRRIDLLLGPVAMLAGIGAGFLALDPGVPWLVVFSVAGLGGALATLAYAGYLARAYRQLCARAGVPFPGLAS